MSGSGMNPNTAAPAANEAEVTDVQVRESVAAKLRHPAIELLARYKAVFATAWAYRAEMAGPKRMTDELAFLPAALSLQDTPVHPAPRRLAFAIMALFVIALVWAIFGQIDIVAIAPGRVVVSQRTKPIQPLERSVVKRVLVKDGDQVQAGQPLIELDPTAANADKTTAQDQVNSALSEVLRTRAIQSALQATLQKKEQLTSIYIGLQPDLAGKFPPEWSNSEVAAAKCTAARRMGRHHRQAGQTQRRNKPPPSRNSYCAGSCQ